MPRGHVYAVRPVPETILLCLVNSNDKKESNKRASCVTLKCDPKRVQLFVTDGARLSPMYRC